MYKHHVQQFQKGAIPFPSGIYRTQLEPFVPKMENGERTLQYRTNGNVDIDVLCRVQKPRETPHHNQTVLPFAFRKPGTQQRNRWLFLRSFNRTPTLVAQQNDCTSKFETQSQLKILRLSTDFMTFFNLAPLAISLGLTSNPHSNKHA